MECQNYLKYGNLEDGGIFLKYPPVHNGTIFIYGDGIGRTVAIWNKETQSCNNDKATHWLRTPDPRKQINMQSKKEES